MQEKYGFVYIWYDRKHKRFYIGCHWGREDDGYICSSPWMKRGYKLRSTDFKRRILSRVYDNKKSLLKEEYKWLSKIEDGELGKRYYNLSNRHFGHWMAKDYIKEKHGMFGKKHTEETKQKMRGRKVSEETKEKLSQLAKKQFSDPENRKKAGQANLGKTPWISGKTHSTETRRKLSESHKEKEPWNKGKKLQPHSEETKLKMRGPRGPQKNPRKLKETIS